MYLANMVAIIKNEADQEIAEERKDKDNKYEYQANVKTLIGSMRDNLHFLKSPYFRHFSDLANVLWYLSGLYRKDFQIRLVYRDGFFVVRS